MADLGQICGRLAADQLPGNPQIAAFLHANAAELRAAKRVQRGESRDSRTRCNQWTRSQRIRTAAAITLVVTIVDAGSTPVFREIAALAAHLRELGMSDRAIARAIGVSDKTVAKSLATTTTRAVGAGEPVADSSPPGRKSGSADGP